MAPRAGAQQQQRPRASRTTCCVAVTAVVAAAVWWQSAPELAMVFEDESGAEAGVHTLVLLRHGESQWNVENRFTGWVDVDVSEKGAEEASNAGVLMKEAGIAPDLCFTSFQKRAIKTLQMALESLDLLWLPVTKSWRLNERMYGDLQGMNKAETTAQFGEEQVTQWRRSFAVPPPPIKDDNPYHPKLEKKYASIPKNKLPLTESLKLTIDRVLPFWNSDIAPALRKGNTVLIAAHGNSLRSLVKFLDDIPEDKIIGLNIPTGVPLVYRLDRQLKPVTLAGHAPDLSGVYLGDPEWVMNKINGVKNQAKAR